MASKSITAPSGHSAEMVADKFKASAVSSFVFEYARESIEANLLAHRMDAPRFQANLALALQGVWEGLDTQKRAIFARVANREAIKFAMACAAMGLMPGGSGIDRKVACIARFKNTKQDNGSWAPTDVTLCAQAEWRGMYDLMMRANPFIANIQIEIVRPGDVVEIDRINNRIISHISGSSIFAAESGIELRPNDWVLHGCEGMFCIVRFKDGTQRIKVITLQDIVRSINASETMRAPKRDYDTRLSSPWVTATDPMLRKSALHALGRDVSVWGGSGMDSAAVAALGVADRAENEVLGNNPKRGEGRTLAADTIYDLAEAITGGRDAADTIARNLGYESAMTAAEAGLGSRIIDELQLETAAADGVDA